MNPSVYLAVGIAASFALLATVPRERRIEAFREEPFPKRTETSYEINAVTGESVYANPNGVLLDQGQQSVRVGASDVSIFSAATERVRVLSSGAVGIGVTEPPAGATLAVRGDICMTGPTIFGPSGASLRAFFRSPFGTDLDFGGVGVVDRSRMTAETLKGEWLQLDLPAAVRLAKYVLSPAKDLGVGGAHVPTRFHLLGGDGKLWYLLDQRDGETFDGAPARKAYDISPAFAYSSYRLVIERLSATPSANDAMLELTGWTLVDRSLKSHPPAPMSRNAQTILGQSYRLSCSKPGNAFSFIGGTLQPSDASLVALSANVSSLDPTSYFQLDFTAADPNYLISLDGREWLASGQTTTDAYTDADPYHSAVTLQAIYNASAPTECLRAYYDGSARVGIGTATAASNLSVVGSIDCTYASFQPGRSDLAKSGANLVYASSGGGRAILNFCAHDPANAYDAQIAVSGGRGVDGAGRMDLSAGSVALNDTLFASTGAVGIGVSAPLAPLHVDGSILATSISVGASATSAAIRGNPSGGLGFVVRGASGETEAATIGAAGLSVASDLVVGGALGIGSARYSAGYVDYAGGLNFRSSVGTAASPSFRSVLSLSAGNVGIGSLSPGAATRGNSVSQGLDVGFAGTADVLRLINTSSAQGGVERSVGMQFVVTDPAGGYQKLQARVVGSTSDPASASLGSLDFYVKCNDTSPAQTPNTDGADVLLRASVVPSGVRVGNLSTPTPASLLVANSLGGGQFGAAGGATDYSLDAVAGDAVLRAERGHSLLLQSGPYRSAICLYRNSANVGVGSAVPRANLDVLGTAFMNGSEPVLAVGASTPSGIGSVPQGASYLLNAVGQDVSGISLPASQSFSYETQSINLQTGSMAYTHGGVAYTSHGARMTINGGKTLTTGSSSEPNRNATIDFFSSGDASPVVRIGQRATYNTAQTYTFMGYNTGYPSTISQSVIGYAIYATDNILVSGASFMAISDRRLKRDIAPIAPADSLRRIEAIEMVSYRMKDPKQPERQIGVIAQQVQRVIPEAVKEGSDEYVANLLIPVRSFENGDGCVLRLDREAEVRAGASVRLIGRANRSVEARVVAVFGPEWRIDRRLEDDEWVVFGTKEERILSVDKDTIAMVAVSALQELSAKYRSLEKRIEALER